MKPQNCLLRILDSALIAQHSVLCLALGAFLFTLCFPAEAQQGQRVFRIGYLSSTDRGGDSLRSEGIRTALRELGYVEGKDIAIDYRYADNKLDRLPELAADLVNLKVDLILIAGGDTQILPAKNATNTIPLILTGSGSDPVKAGFVQSLAHPGGNITGLTILNTEVGRKRLELLKEAVPKVVRVAVLYRPDLPSNVRELKEVQSAAHALNLTVQPLEVRDAAGPKTFPSKQEPFSFFHRPNPLGTN